MGSKEYKGSTFLTNLVKERLPVTVDKDYNSPCQLLKCSTDFLLSTLFMTQEVRK